MSKCARPGCNNEDGGYGSWCSLECTNAVIPGHGHAGAGTRRRPGGPVKGLVTTPGDHVKSPSHYIGTDGLEVKEVIRQFDLGFFTGGAVKYILRAGKKGDAIEDFKKAIEMLNIEIDNINRKGSK